MITALIWVVLIFLAVISIIDLKVRKIPSIFLTGMLFTVALISILNQSSALSLGILGFIMAYLLYEADFIRGVADIKVFTMISFMVLDIYSFLGFIVLLMFFGIIYKSVIKIRTKDTECAFIPVFLAVYVVMLLIGGLA